MPRSVPIANKGASRGGAALKRVFDIAAASLGLVLFSPVLLACALAVRLSSPGPTLFKQERIGRYGKPFKILKFRTMCDPGSGFVREITVGRDPRITPIGERLRRWKLDEIPQLWNVVVGDMSLVGPRPEVPRYVVHYPPEMREAILSVRPGITDPCSIELRNESELLAAAEDPDEYYVGVLLPQKLRAGCDYIARRSFVSDVTTIIRTIFALGGK